MDMTAAPTLHPVRLAVIRGLISGAVAAVVAAAGWWALLGWDHSGPADSTGREHGPYEAWQVILLVGVLGALAIWLGIRRSLFLGPVVAASVLTASFVAGVSRSHSDGLWVVGAAMLAVGGFLAILVVALVSHHVVTAARRNRR